MKRERQSKSTLFLADLLKGFRLRHHNRSIPSKDDTLFQLSAATDNFSTLDPACFALSFDNLNLQEGVFRGIAEGVFSSPGLALVELQKHSRPKWRAITHKVPWIQLTWQPEVQSRKVTYATRNKVEEQRTGKCRKDQDGETCLVKFVSAGMGKKVLIKFNSIIWYLVLSWVQRKKMVSPLQIR